MPESITSQAIYILHMIESKEKAARVSRGSVILERYTEILSMENWKEMSQCLQWMLMEGLSPEDGQSQKANLFAGTIRKMIQEEYADPNLCLQQISDMVKMSGQYVGRVFKGTVGLSVAEYINEYRMEKSVEIMMKTGCTVNEVLEKAGIESESQYYLLFKKNMAQRPGLICLKNVWQGMRDRER